jgi:hypothetical protein
MLKVDMPGKGMLEAWVYSVVEKDEHVEPDRYYLGIIRAAAEDFGFPAAYREMLDSFSPGG